MVKFFLKYSMKVKNFYNSITKRQLFKKNLQEISHSWDLKEKLMKLKELILFLQTKLIIQIRSQCFPFLKEAKKRSKSKKKREKENWKRNVKENSREIHMPTTTNSKALQNSLPNSSTATMKKEELAENSKRG